MRKRNVFGSVVGPARAGMIRAYDFVGIIELGWPRTSGDDPELMKKAEENIKLAPHERG